jgi:drug/metabolite transporter (DMT)-like permease
MNNTSTQVKPPIVPKLQIYFALLALYLIWGSTYLGIKYAIETIPTFLMAGSRNFMAGLVIYFSSKIILKNAPKPSFRDWISCAISGFLMLFVGNGGITLVEHWIPTGYVALIVACVPVWIVIFQWFLFKETPSWLVVAGIFAGFTGVGLLMSKNMALAGAEDMFFWGVGITLFTTVCWSSAVIFMKTRKVGLSAIQIAGMQQIAGGAGLLILSGIRGEWFDFHLSQVSDVSWLGYFYLIVFGSLIGFSTFAWLSQVANPALVSTYTYVNPLVAVVLGTLFLKEGLTDAIILPATLIILAVVLITSGKKK